MTYSSFFPAQFATLRSRVEDLTVPSRRDFKDRSELEELRHTVARQRLISQTLLMLLIEKKVVGEDEFRDWMARVDALDGHADGQLREDKAPVLCPKCGRKSPGTAAQCAYCGEPFSQEFLDRRATGR